MNNNVMLYKQSVPVSYSMFVDKDGNFGNHEVREDEASDPSAYRRSSFKDEDGALLLKQELEELKRDAAFRRFLGGKEHKDAVAIPFLRAFWGHRTEINDLVLQSADFLGDTPDARNVLPDVVWQEPETRAVFVTEMQRQEQDFYFDRISLYEGKTRAMYAEKGRDWNFEQVPIFVLGLADFDLGRKGPDVCMYEYASMDADGHGELFNDKDWKMMIDLPKAGNNKPVAYSEQDKWLFLLNNFHRLGGDFNKIQTELPAFLKDGSFDQVLSIAENLNRIKMEEFMDMALELRLRDRIRAGEKRGEVRGKEWARREMIKRLFQGFPDFKKESPQKIASLLGVDAQLVKSVLTA